MNYEMPEDVIRKGLAARLFVWHAGDQVYDLTPLGSKVLTEYCRERTTTNEEH